MKWPFAVVYQWVGLPCTNSDQYLCFFSVPDLLESITWRLPWLLLFLFFELLLPDAKPPGFSLHIFFFFLFYKSSIINFSLTAHNVHNISWSHPPSTAPLHLFFITMFFVLFHTTQISREFLDLYTLTFLLRVLVDLKKSFWLFNLHETLLYSLPVWFLRLEKCLNGEECLLLQKTEFHLPTPTPSSSQSLVTVATGYLITFSGLQGYFHSWAYTTPTPIYT